MAELVVKLVNGELAGKTLQEINKQVRDAAKELSKAKAGTEEFVKASEKLNKAKGLQADLKKQIEGTAEASDFLKKSWNTLPGAQFFNKIGDSFGFMKKGVGGLISQFGMLKIAIASTGIGLLVVALGSLIAYFQSTQEGIDKVTAVTRPLKAIFDALVGVLQNLGGTVFKKLAKATEDPKQAFKDLGDFIVNNFINRFKAIALLGPAIQKIFSKDWKEGLKDLGNAALQAVSGVEDVIGKVMEGAKQFAAVVDEAYQKGKRMDALQKEIERAEIRQITRSKELELLLKQQKDIVEDSTKSWDERKIAAEKALSIQNQMLNDELSLLNKRIEKMQIEQSLNDTSRDQEKELAELIAKRSELQAKSTEQAIEFKKKVAEFDAQIIANEKAAIQNIQDLRLQVMKEGMDKEIAAINLETERKIEALIGSAEQIKEQEGLLEDLRLRSIQEIQDRYKLEAAEKDKQAKDEALARQAEFDQKRKQAAQEVADFEASLLQTQEDTALSSFEMLGNLITRKVGDEKAAQVGRKTIALAEIGLNLQREKAANALAAANYRASLLASSVAAGPFAAAAAIAATVKAAAYQAGLNVQSNVRAAIAAASVLAFRRGGVPGMVRNIKMRPGVLRGPSHEGGGIPLVAEGDEIILTKGVYRNPRLRAMASAINVAGGGIQFASGGPINPLPSSSSYGSSQADTLNASGEISSLKSSIEFFGERMMQYAESNDRRIDRIQVHNNLQDTRNGIQTLNDLKAEADL